MADPREAYQRIKSKYGQEEAERPKSLYERIVRGGFEAAFQALPAPFNLLANKGPFGRDVTKEVVKFGKEAGQSVFRNVGSLALTGERYATKALTGKEGPETKEIPEAIRPLFGADTIKTLPLRVREAERTIKESPLAKEYGLDKYAFPLAFGGVVGGSALDFLPSGAGGKSVIRQIAKNADPVAIKKILMEGFGAADEVAEGYSKVLAGLSKEADVKTALKAMMKNNVDILPGASRAAIEPTEAIIPRSKSVEEVVEETPTVAQSLEPLATEARKYKSAEEFYNNVGKIRDNYDWSYLDEMKADKAAGYSYSHSDFANLSKLEATNRGKESRTFFRAGEVGKDGDIWLTPQKAGAEQYANAGGTKMKEYKVATENPLVVQDIKAIEKIIGRKLDSSDNFTNSPTLKQKVIDYAKKNGYDSVLMPDSFPDGAGGMESLVVWDSSIVKTKSQLTDFYNKAVGGQPPRVPPPPKGPEGAITPSASPEDPVGKVMEALKGASDVRGEQEKLYSLERARRLGLVEKIAEEKKGLEGFLAQKAALEGELPKVKFEPFIDKVEKDTADALFDMIQESPRIAAFERIRAKDGLLALFSGEIPQQSQLKLLQDVFGSNFAKTILDKRSTLEKAGELGKQIIATPRALMSSVDFSAPFRQGLFLAARNPKEFFGNFKTMFKAFADEKALKASQDQIAKMPTFDLMREHRLALTDVGEVITEREEAFMSSLAEKIPGIGRGVKASGRAYTGFLNKLRADVFEKLVKNAELQGLKPRENPEIVSNIAKFVNTGTGRGSLGSLERAAGTLSTAFFSPRLIASRLSLLNPAFYARLDPFTRKEALKTLFAFVGSGTTVLTLASLAGADVEVDPRSSDFGKIKVGDTRIDIWGGFQQYAVLAGRLSSGESMSATSKEVTELGKEFGSPTRWDVLMRTMFENKAAPVISFIIQMLKGKDAVGEPFNPTEETIERFVPMAFQDVYEIYQEDPDLLPLSILGFFGLGVQSFSDKRSNPARKALERIQKKYQGGDKARDALKRIQDKYK